MTDNRTKNSHPSDLYDYRRAKLLLDVLALDNEDARGHLVTNLEVLCKNWEIFPVYYNNPAGFRLMDIPRTLQRLAQHCQEHGREEYQARKIESEEKS